MTADGHSDSSIQCQDRCIAFLETFVQEGKLYIDDAGHILEEYIECLGLAGQPGVGQRFVRFWFDNQATTRARRVSLTPRQGDHNRLFDEFPAHPGLSEFDRSDQKFVSVALKSNVPLFNAVDSDYEESADALSACGLEVIQLCK